MDALEEFVAEHASDLVGAASARSDAGPEPQGDGEIARLLGDIWLAGPPFTDPLERARRRLSVGGGDLVDLGASTSAETGRAELSPERLLSLVVTVRGRVDRRRRGRGTRRLVQGVVVGAVTVLVGVGVVQVLQSAGEREAARPGAPSAASSLGGAGADQSGCAYSVCNWLIIQKWSVGVKAAMFTRLDPGGAVLGVPGASPMMTTVAEVDQGRLVEAGFGSAVIRSTADFGVWITATSRQDLVPVCGGKTGERCQDRIDRNGLPVRVSSSETVSEVIRQVGPRSWVYVRVETTDRAPIGLDRVISLAVDDRLILPA